MYPVVIALLTHALSKEGGVSYVIIMRSLTHSNNFAKEEVETHFFSGGPQLHQTVGILSQPSHFARADSLPVRGGSPRDLGRRISKLLGF